MRTAASSDVSRGAIGRARRTDPPSGGLFHVWARISAGSNAAPYNLHGPVRIPDEFPTVRALGRAAAAVLLLPAVLRRGGAGQGRRPDTTREFESVSRVADVLSRTGDVEGAARALLDELAELFDLGFAALTFVSDDARHASGYLARVGGEDLDWWRDMRLDLDREPSGIASAVFEATAITVYDTASSGVVSRRLADAVGAKSIFDSHSVRSRRGVAEASKWSSGRRSRRVPSCRVIEIWSSRHGRRSRRRRLRSL